MVQKHLHMYKQVRSGSSQFKCIDPECTHLSTKSLIKGNLAICNGCAKEFVLTTEALRRVYPKCNNCIKGNTDSIESIEEEIQKNVDTSAIESLVKGL